MQKHRRAATTLLSYLTETTSWCTNFDLLFFLFTTTTKIPDLFCACCAVPSPSFPLLGFSATAIFSGTTTAPPGDCKIWHQSPQIFGQGIAKFRQKLPHHRPKTVEGGNGNWRATSGCAHVATIYSPTSPRVRTERVLADPVIAASPARYAVGSGCAYKQCPARTPDKSPPYALHAACEPFRTPTTCAAGQPNRPPEHLCGDREITLLYGSGCGCKCRCGCGFRCGQRR
ncbi:hypothetical protein C8R45DRAFT_516281 [Mycena sanguinolenta]|nr:hypothetical protein C8R45DRAFT_161804 [Mycena sanguinolenta]KAJ6463313.1 hypothetical protein C8R45DRAFT_516281 [Mycena sanguinolenta]